MKVEIWHKFSGACSLTHTLDMYAVTDQAVCELAYLHTKPSSVSQMQNPEFQSTQIGDVIVIHSEEGEDPDRAYAVLPSACDGVSFEKVSLPLQ